MSMLIAHVADTHLGYAQYGLEERENDFSRVFLEVVNKALEDHVDVLVHSGDAFHDPRPRIRTLRAFRDAVKELHARGVPLVAVPGSHDMQRRRGVPPLALFDDLGVRLLTVKRPIWEYKGVLFAGFQYLPRHRREVMLALLSKLGGMAASHVGKSVLILHQALEHVLPVAYELSLSELPKTFHYYALGHVHRPYTCSYGKGVLAYPGSTEVVDVTEISYISEKGFLLVDLTGDEPEIERVKLESVRPQLLYEVTPKDFTELAAKAAMDAARCQLKPVVHVRVLGEVDRRLVDGLRKRLEGVCLKLRVEMRGAEEGGEKQASFETVDVRSAIEACIKTYLGRPSPDLVSLAYELLRILSSSEVTTDEAVRRAVQEVKEAYGVTRSED